MEDLQQGRLKLSDVRMASSSSSVPSLVDKVKFWMGVGSFSHLRALTLRRMNRLVEIARLPPKQQKTAEDALEQFLMKDPPQLAGYSPTNFIGILRYAADFRIDQAKMRCLIVALAVERYRRAHGRWPDNLSALCPPYLTRVPLNLFDGQPLSYCKNSDGVVISSDAPAGRTKVDVRLWDVAQRRQPPRSPATLTTDLVPKGKKR
jgi:hypothetical protein